MILQSRRASAFFRAHSPVQLFSATTIDISRPTHNPRSGPKKHGSLVYHTLQSTTQDVQKGRRGEIPCVKHGMWLGYTLDCQTPTYASGMARSTECFMNSPQSCCDVRLRQWRSKGIQGRQLGGHLLPDLVLMADCQKQAAGSEEP